MADPWLAGQLAQVSWGNPLALSAAVDLVQHILRRGLAAELFAWSIARHGAAWRWAFGVLGAGAPVSVAVRLFMPESRVWLTTYRVPPASVSVLVYLALIAIFASFPVFGGRSERRGCRRCSAAAGAFGTLGYAAYAWALLTGVYGAYGAQMSPMVLGLLLWMVAGAGYLGGAWLAEIYPTDVRAAAANFTYYVGRSLEGGLAPLGALAQSLGGDARTAMVMGIVGVAGVALLVLELPETRGRPLRQALGRAEEVLPE